MEHLLTHACGNLIGLKVEEDATLTMKDKEILRTN